MVINDMLVSIHYDTEIPHKIHVCIGVGNRHGCYITGDDFKLEVESTDAIYYYS